MFMSKNLVSIFVGGAQKSGTRSVTKLLRNNSQCGVHQSKEGHFFDRDEYFNGLSPDAVALCAYHNGFTKTSKDLILCDISPDYIFRNNAVARIQAYNPNAHWILILRNPIDRAFSAWNMEVNRKTETLDFEAALKLELKGQPEERSHDRFAYIGRSRYGQQLERLWQYFPKANCHIWPAEWVWENPNNSLYKSLLSLGITGVNTAQLTHTHKGVYINKAPIKANELLKSELEFELNELPDLLGWSYNPWIV